MQRKFYIVPCQSTIIEVQATVWEITIFVLTGLLTMDVSCHLLFLSSASSPVPAITLRNLGPNTRIMVVVVLSWVLRNPRKYFMSGPQLGRNRTLGLNSST